MATVFLSKRRGALLLQLAPESAPIAAGDGVTLSLKYQDRDGEKINASLSVSHDGGALDARGHYMPEESVAKTVALALFSLEGRMHDIFPSGHTVIALLVLWLARRHRLRGWPLLVPVVTGLLLGTVYLRYHYGVDVLAGAVLAVLVAWIVSRCSRARLTS